MDPPEAVKNLPGLVLGAVVGAVATVNETVSGDGGETGGGGTGGGGCQGKTNVGYGFQEGAAYVSTSTDGGNVWKTYAQTNFVAGVSWWGNCNSAGPASYWAGTGYASAVRGPNQPAMGGVYLIDIALAHMGGGEGQGSSDGFGYKSIKANPWITLDKPSSGRIQLESHQVLGYNKASCNAWPSGLVDALALVPTNYQWSVILHFATKDYCTTTKSSFDSGIPGNLDRSSFKITKASLSQQYEDGGRITFKAVNTGVFSMPYTYVAAASGQVRAHGNPDASFSAVLPLTTSSMPMAMVV